MNTKTARLIRKFSLETKTPYNQNKRGYAKLNRNEKFEAKQKMLKTIS